MGALTFNKPKPGLSFAGRVSGVSPSGRQYALWPVLNFQYTSYHPYDEGYQWQNGILTKTAHPNPAILVQLDDTLPANQGHCRLKENNIHGNKARFTNTYGEHVAASTVTFAAYVDGDYLDADGVTKAGAFSNANLAELDWKRAPHVIQDHYYGIEIIAGGYGSIAHTNDSDYATHLLNAYNELHLITGGTNWYMTPYWLFLLLTLDEYALSNYAVWWIRNTATFNNTATTNPEDTTEYLYSGREVGRSKRLKSQTFGGGTYYYRKMADA